MRSCSSRTRSILLILIVSTVSLLTSVVAITQLSPKGRSTLLILAAHKEKLQGIRLGLEKSVLAAAQYAVVGAFAAGIILGGIASHQVNIPGTRIYHTASEIPSQAYTDQKVLRGTVVSVTDGDTLRLLHKPFWRQRRPGGRASDNTINVRLYGVDAPEVGKFGSAGQLFADEARDYVSHQVLGKTVNLKLLRKDQYMRAVGAIEYGGAGPFFRKDLSLEVLRQGFAVIYRGGGASYNNKLPAMKQLQSAATTAKKGLWSQGVPAETPGQYKARIKAENMEAGNLTVKSDATGSSKNTAVADAAVKQARSNGAAPANKKKPASRAARKPAKRSESLPVEAGADLAVSH